MGCFVPGVSMKNLFDQPLVHSRDPITSFEAADKLVESRALSRQEDEVWKAIKTFLSDWPFNDFTAKTLTSYVNYYTAQRRLSGLYNKGLIERTGERRNGCMAWRIRRAK